MQNQCLASRRCGSSTVVSSRTGCAKNGSHGRKTSVVVQAMSDGPLLKRPELKRPERKVDEVPDRKLFTEESATPSESTAAAPVASTSSALKAFGGVTVEYQRQKAKEMVKYFKNVKLEDEIVSSKVFGWTPENEINNGRWVMMGIAIGMLTEYATGVDFPNQLKLMVQYLGIADLE